MTEAIANGRPPVEAYFAEGERRGLRWTRLRWAVLRLIWSAGEPIGAYEAAARLKVGTRRTHTTSVYRCLHRLQEVGLVIPVCSRKRFILSPDPAVSHWGMLLCRTCRDCLAVDLSDALDGLEREIRQTGFTPRAYVIECEGICRACTEAGRSP
jgi:Fur family zinc uptake transcriptional regulator